MSIGLLGEGFEEFSGESYLMRGGDQGHRSRRELDLEAFALRLQLIELGNYESVGRGRGFWASRGLPLLGHPRGKGGILDAALLSEYWTTEATLLESGEDFVAILLRVMSPSYSVRLDDCSRDLSRFVR